MKSDINILKTDDSRDQDAKLRASKITYLFRNQTIGNVANVINAAILAIIQWHMVNRTLLITWLTAVMLIVIGRTLTGRLFFRQGHGVGGKWYNIFLAGVFCSGGLWGAAGVVLFPANSLVHQMFTAFTIGGMVAGASAAYCAVLKAFFVFSLPAMLPIIVYSYSLGDSIHLAMGIMMMLFLILMSGTCYRNFRINEASIRLRFENQDLIAYLAAAKRRTEEINRELKAENAERLNIETQLENYQKELESIVEKRTAELESRNRQLALEIAERRHAQSALAESEERYRLLVESANVGVALIQNETAVFTNRFAVAMSGYSDEEIRKTPFLEFLHPEDRQMAAEYYLKRLGREPAPDTYQIRFLTKTGKMRWLEINAVLTVYDDKPAVLIFFKDVSLQRHLEAQLLQSEKMAAIGQLAAGVAHEINNPIGFVNSNLQTLLGYVGDIHQLIDKYQSFNSTVQSAVLTGMDTEALTGEIRSIRDMEAHIDLPYLLTDCPQLIRESLEGADRIKTIVMDLKDFAHPGEVDRKPADINKLIESTLNIVWNELKYHVTVTKDFGELPEIIIHPQQINQVFMNLLVNAAQAIEGDGEIKIQTRTVNDYIEIKISDTGQGIAPENLTKIFDPFFTTKPVGKGTGLGLNVSYNIVNNHNGAITVESQPGNGATFTVRLPM